jgi:hypothetical protein
MVSFIDSMPLNETALESLTDEETPFTPTPLAYEGFITPDRPSCIHTLPEFASFQHFNMRGYIRDHKPKLVRNLSESTFAGSLFSQGTGEEY